jgi:predicted acylesterase/phospholipase RssA
MNERPTEDTPPARTHFVLGGGAAMGAFQAGGLLALAEAGVLPDRLVGCSAGALNAAFLAGRPTPERARNLTEFWLDPATQNVLTVSPWGRAKGLAAILTRRGTFIDAGPLRRLIARRLPAHDVSELAVPLTVTTTCLDCECAVHHQTGPLVDVLLASCALPGLLPPGRLPDGHLHVDGGIVSGVPIQPAIQAAGPHDRILVLDCGFAPITCLPGGDCALPGERTYVPPPQDTRWGAFDVTMRAFSVARSVANRASVATPLADPRVRVLPHVGDAVAAGLLRRWPVNPRDFSHGRTLVEAGRACTAAWLERGGLDGVSSARFSTA